MKLRKTLAVALCYGLAISSLSGCGGGGGGGNATPPPPPPPPPTGGISRLGIAIGPVSTFGSIVVNGVRYDTATATFSLDGAPAVQSDLGVGDVVTVTGTIDDNGTSGTAETVSFDDDVTGPIESIDQVAQELVVLGQLVLIRPDTSFDDSFAVASIEGLSVGQLIEVSGQVDANDAIVATRIEPKPAATQFEVHGTVSGLDAANLRFNINNLLVNYSSAMLDNFPAGIISDGDFVEAKGAALGAAGELLADEVELETPFPNVADGDRAEIEGFITRFVSAVDFDVAGFPVTTTASTVYEGGTVADLGLNIKLEAEGEIDANGVIAADKIDIRPSRAVRATANVDSIDAAGNSLAMLGITITVDALTRFADKSNANVEPLTLADINVTDHVEIRGDEFPAGSGQIRATIFEREDPDPEATLQGFVETISDPTFTILGVTIETGGATIFRDENDSVISATDFFNQVVVNSLVKATGTEVSDMTIAAQEVEFELEF